MPTVAEAYVPALLEPYPTLRTLYRAVVDNPAEDEPRLQFGDAAREAAEECREVDRQPLTAWADLIDVQFKIHRLGKPHKKVVNCSDLVKRGGPDYFTCEVDEVAGFEPGDRIDFELHPSWASTWGMKRKYPGLLVRRIDPIDAYKKTLILVRDENSKPFPDQELRELQEKESELLLDSSTFCIHDRANYTYLRGFPSRAALPWSHWAASGDRMVKWFPLAEVEIQVGVRLEYRANYAILTGALIPGTLLGPPNGIDVHLRGVSGDPFIRLEDTNANETQVNAIALKLLKQRWPSVVSWRFPGVSL